MASKLTVSNDYTRNTQMLNARNGESSMDDPLYVPEQRREYSYEINYGVQATKWLMVRPNLQYVKYPGGLKETNGAVVGGCSLLLISSRSAVRH